MRNGVSVFSKLCAAVVLQTLFASASLAADEGDSLRQQGEDRWVPSLSITGGATIQNQDGFADSVHFVNMSPSPVPLQGQVDGNDLAVSPFVGGELGLMTPALPIPTRPRLFLSGGLLPTFASDRAVALDGDPGCIHGPDPQGAECSNLEGQTNRIAYGEDSLNGQGTKTSAQVDTLVFDAKLGVAFPLQVGKRQVRVKPSLGWINYKLDAEGLVVDGACDPVDVCTDVYNVIVVPPVLINTGYLRETTLTANESHRFNGIGPGVEVEMDAGRFGPLGVSLFVGMGAYAILGERTISFGTSELTTDQIGTDFAVAEFAVKVDPWMYRAGVGIRFQWLGSGE